VLNTTVMWCAVVPVGHSRSQFAWIGGGRVSKSVAPGLTAKKHSGLRASTS
jgi:hypothetical protein